MYKSNIRTKFNDANQLKKSFKKIQIFQYIWAYRPMEGYFEN